MLSWQNGEKYVKVSKGHSLLNRRRGQRSQIKWIPLQSSEVPKPRNIQGNNGLLCILGLVKNPPYTIKKIKGIRLATQGTLVQSLVQEDSACWGTIKPRGHNYWAHSLWLLSPLAYSSCSPAKEATTMGSPHTSIRESPCAATKTQHSQNTK